MKPRLTTSLRHKLLAVMLLTTLVSLVVALGSMITYDVRSYHQELVSDITAQAELLGRTSAPAMVFDDAKTATENLALLRSRPKVRAAAIYKANRKLFASYVSGAHQAPPTITSGVESVQIRDGSLTVLKRIVENGELIGTVYVRADYELYDRMLSYSSIALAVAAAAMLVALLVSFWLQRIVTRPILAMARVARDVVTKKDYSRRVERISGDEVGALADSFNDMLTEIETRTQGLEASNHEITRLNRELEQRVKERTRQLETSNRELALAGEAADKANRAKSAFLSSMSHELRTPLNAIIGFGQLLSSETMQASDAQKRGYTQHIVAAGGHLLTLINEILNLAQIESGKLSLSLEPVLLEEMLDECRTMVEPLAAQRGIRLVFPVVADMGVVADRTRLRQVLLNLLSNAIKYNRDGGAVLVDCVPGEEGGRVRLSVQDTGLGLSAEQVASLFQPFNRLGQEGGAQEGSGIGLVVTKQLVELMGGTMGVTSKPGMGSAFWLELPAAALPVGEALVAARQTVELVGHTRGEPGRVRTVLYVEDNPASLQLMEQILSFRSDLRLLSAPDGQTGVDMAVAQQPDVVLMDINLPRLDGNAALVLLRQDPRTAHIPVIALTASAMPGAIKQGMAAGFFRYLTKPVQINELLEALNEALGEARPETRADPHP